jgi:hypothetical protein
MPRKSADNPYATQPSSNPYATNPYATAPDVTGLDVPTGEGEYWMTNQHGGRLHVPYSKVRQAAQAGYEMKNEDRDQFMTDSRADKKLGRLFPDLKLPEGVKIVGMNPAGQPMFGPTGTAPKGSAAGRFLSSAGEQLMSPFTGTARALWQGPQTPEEAATESRVGPVGMRFERMFVNPSLDQYRQAREEWAQAAPLSMHPTPEQLRHRQLAAGHGLATVIPLVGPAAAQISEKMGQQAGTGDYAGAAGTLTGAAALEAAPKLGAKGVKYATENMPLHAIKRVIRPMAKDVAFGKNPSQAVLDQGIWGVDLESMARKTAAKMKATGEQINAMAKDPKYVNTKVDLKWVYEPLNDAINAAQRAGDRQLYKRLWEVRDELRSEWQGVAASKTPKLQRTGRRPGVMSPEDALEFRRLIGKRIRWANDAMDEEVNAALAGLYSSVKDKLADAIADPKWKQLNKDYADLAAAKSAIERRAPVAERQAYVNLFDVATAASTIPFFGAKAIPLLLARKALEQPLVKTLGAQGAYRVGKVLPKKVPLKATVPAVGVLQSQQGRQRPKTLRELQAEARRRRPAGAEYDVQTGTATGAPQ